MPIESDAYQRFTARYAEDHIPWDSGVVPPEVRALVEDHAPTQPGAPLPPGRALDVGCGTGTSSIYLAQHGWQVTGIDWIEDAVKRAKEKAKNAGLDSETVRFLQVDVTAPDLLPDHPQVSLWLDIGCFHVFGSAGRSAYVEHASRLLAPGGILLMYGWLHRKYQGQVMRLKPENIRALFAPAFTLVHANLGEEKNNPERAAAWYTLQRVPA